MTKSQLAHRGDCQHFVKGGDCNGGSLGSACVLMIDDDPSARLTFGSILCGAGHDFVGAANAREGIRLARARQPDVAIVDLRLPDFSGLEVLSAIQSSNLLTVSVLLTGFWDIKAEFEAKSAGAWACVAKPLFAEELLELVHLALVVRARRSPASQINVVRVQPIRSHATARLVEKLTMFIGAPVDEPTLRRTAALSKV